MCEATDSTAVVLPMAFQLVDKGKIRLMHSYHVAAVTRGILFSGAILLSSIDIFES